MPLAARLLHPCEPFRALLRRGVQGSVLGSQSDIALLQLLDATAITQLLSAPVVHRKLEWKEVRTQFLLLHQPLEGRKPARYARGQQPALGEKVFSVVPFDYGQLVLRVHVQDKAISQHPRHRRGSRPRKLLALQQLGCEPGLLLLGGAGILLLLLGRLRHFFRGPASFDCFSHRRVLSKHTPPTQSGLTKRIGH